MINNVLWIVLNALAKLIPLEANVIMNYTLDYYDNYTPIRCTRCYPDLDWGMELMWYFLSMH